MIKGIGCDIVEIARFKEKQEAFAQTILTKKEYACYETFTSIERKLEFLAGRFAAKEAIFKALQDPTLTISKIEVIWDENKRPICNIETGTIHVTISHEKAYALAYAVYEI